MLSEFWQMDKVVTINFACLCVHNFLRHHRSDAYLPPGYVESEDANQPQVEGAWRREGAMMFHGKKA